MIVKITNWIISQFTESILYNLNIDWRVKENRIQKYLFKKLNTKMLYFLVVLENKFFLFKMYYNYNYNIYQVCIDLTIVSYLNILC